MSILDLPTRIVYVLFQRPGKSSKRLSFASDKDGDETTSSEQQQQEETQKLKIIVLSESALPIASSPVLTYGMVTQGEEGGAAAEKQPPAPKGTLRRLRDDLSFVPTTYINLPL